MTWTCSDCTTVLEEQFTECWACGATRPGFQPARDLFEDDVPEPSPDLAPKVITPAPTNPAEQVFYVAGDSQEWQATMAEFGRISLGLRHRRMRLRTAPRHRTKADFLWSVSGWSTLSSISLFVTIFLTPRIADWAFTAMFAGAYITLSVAIFAARAAAGRELQGFPDPPAQGAT